MKFKLESTMRPEGDQPQAIKKLVGGLSDGMKEQTLMGVTGSGKTFTMANVIQETQKPTLIISPNKTLAAQLYSEFRELFPNNGVHYFVSYYDYYQPEAYIPQSDTFIAKETDINEEIDRLRHLATQSVLTQRDTIIVASVSCIYGLGSPVAYKAQAFSFYSGQAMGRQEFLKKLVSIYFKRDDVEFGRGTFRVKGDTVEVHPATGDHILRFEFHKTLLERITEVRADAVGTKVRKFRTKDDVVEQKKDILLFPAKHYVTDQDSFGPILKNIRAEMVTRVKELKKKKKLVEAQRLEQRTKYDLEMIKNTGYVNGIENYSRHFDGRAQGDPPYVLVDYFPKDFLTIIDESHITVPQIGGMHAGDQSRKRTLVDYGFRLPSALDNRPLKFQEFKKRMNQVVFTTATPGTYEKEHSKQVVEQVIRPTGLLDPKIEIRDSETQINNLIKEIKKTIKKKERILALTLTKKMSEELSDYLQEKNIRVNYLHSDVGTFERTQILHDLRKKIYDVIVGINLLREGIDLPEVGLVAILDADYQGFLRNHRTLIQMIGRASRNKNGLVVMYARNKKSSEAMRLAIQETDRRRKKQMAYNKKHKITPKTITKALPKDFLREME